MRPFVLAAAAGISLFMPAMLPPYPLIVLCYMMVFATACLGLNLLLGTTGLLSLGHAAYFGVGAYTGAFLYRFWSLTSFELYLLSGVLTSTLLAAAIGFLCVRATKIHFAVMTLAFNMVVYSLFISGAVFRLLGPLGWSLFLLGGGSMYIPRLSILGTEYAAGEFIPAFYYVIAAALFSTAFLLWRINRSPFGKSLRALRDNETRALYIGIPVRQYRWLAFVLSGVFMGLAGALYGQLSRQITPDQLHWLFSAKLVLAIVLGGTREFLGPILGALVFGSLEEFALRRIGVHNMVLGGLLIIIIYFFPRGIAGALRAFIDTLKRR